MHPVAFTSSKIRELYVDSMNLLVISLTLVLIAVKELSWIEMKVGCPIERAANSESVTVKSVDVSMIRGFTDSLTVLSFRCTLSKLP